MSVTDGLEINITSARVWIKAPQRQVRPETRVTKVQTYRSFVTLECGHTRSYTHSATSKTFRHPKAMGCAQCPAVVDKRPSTR